MFALTTDPTILDTITISNVCKKAASRPWESPHWNGLTELETKAKGEQTNKEILGLVYFSVFFILGLVFPFCSRELFYLMPCVFYTLVLIMSFCSLFQCSNFSVKKKKECDFDFSVAIWGLVIWILENGGGYLTNKKKISPQQNMYY